MQIICNCARYGLNGALRHALDTDDPEQVTPILDELAAVLAQDALDPLCNCVDHFDFRGAEQRL